MPITPKTAEHVPQRVTTTPELIYDAPIDKGATQIHISNGSSGDPLLVHIPAMHDERDWVCLSQGEGQVFRSGYRGIKQVYVKAAYEQSLTEVVWYVLAN